MNKIVFLIVGFTLTATYAEKPNWLPENLDEISKKCLEENQLQSDFVVDKSMDNAQVHNLFLCKAKGSNIYSDDKGLNVDRLIYMYSFYQTDKTCKKPLVQDCVNKYKDLASAGKMIFKVIHCIAEKEDELKSNDKDDKTDC